MQKLVGVVLVIVGGLPWGEGGSALAWCLLGVGLILLVVADIPLLKEAQFPETYNDIPMRTRWKGYRIYSTSLIHSDHEHVVILEDGGKVSEYWSEGFKAIRGIGPLYVLNKQGKQVFPGTK